MEATTKKDIARNAFIYALATTVMVLSVATVLSGVFGKQQRDLATRVDRNAAAIVCILQLGLDQKNSPPRSTENVNLCLADPQWVTNGNAVPQEGP